MPGAFLQGYLSQQQADDSHASNELRRAGDALGILSTIRQQQDQDAVRGVLSSAPDPVTAIPKLMQLGPVGVSAAQQLAQLQQAMRKETAGQPIGSGGLLMGDGRIIPPAVRPTPEVPHSIGAGGLRLPDGTVVPPVTGAPKEQWGEPFTMNGVVVQKNAVNGQIRTAVSREPQIRIDNPAPITAVTIADPKDPSKTIVVDGRTGTKIGDGPKPSATGAIDLKLQQQMPAAQARMKIITQGMDRLEAALAELERDPGLPRITGTVAGRTPNVTNTATGAQNKLDSIKSQIFQSSLQAMREASKTGGAVGNVSDREGDKLERTLAGLNQAAGTPDFKKELRKARDQVRLSREIVNNAYQEQFGNVQPYQPGGARSGGMSLEERLKKYNE